MASPHAAGALALLASMSNPNNATDVYNLYDQVKAAGNLNWTDDSGDGIQEPLLDVSNTAIFNPVLVAGTGGTPPAAPANLTATAVSSSQINLTWTDSDNTEQGFKIERCSGNRLQQLRPSRYGRRERDQLQRTSASPHPPATATACGPTTRSATRTIPTQPAR